jgi:5-formyltetrahydrofolate cyclo-ligase
MSTSKKDDIRKELKKKREGLPYDEVIKKSRIIKERLYSLDDYKESIIILFYVSYDNEVSTHDMIKETLKKGKRVIVPFIDEDRSMLLSELRRWSELTLGAYNILQPKREYLRVVDPDEIDLIIVPGIGFDMHGNRIGHGFGYYDDLLKKTKKAKKYGLAFESQIIDLVPCEKHDVKVDRIITEERVIEC